MTSINPMVVTFTADDVQTLPGESGSHAFMYRGAGLTALREAFGRDGIAAKIHHLPLRPSEALDEYVWGYHYLPPGEQTPLVEAVTIQNLYALHGLAPRVYGLAVWQDQYGQLRPVQVTEDLGRCDWSQHPPDVYALFDRIRALGDEWGVVVPGRDSGVHNCVADKWVDFNGFRLTDTYRAGLLDRYYQGVRWGDRPYQQVLGAHNGTEACRDVADRIRDLELDLLDFTPATVADIGCSGGQFLNYLTTRYGARGVGFDSARAIPAAAEYSAAHGAWNIDYHAADLRQPEAVTGSYDLVLFLSMSRHVGLPEYVKAAARKRLIVEAHSEHDDTVRDWLGAEFEIVHEQRSADYGRLVLHAERRPC